MTWDSIVTKYHKKYVAEIGIQPKTEIYLIVGVKKDILSFDRRRGLEEERLTEEMCVRKEQVSRLLILQAYEEELKKCKIPINKLLLSDSMCYT